VNVAAETEAARPDIPEPEFFVTGAGHLTFAATPTMVFSAGVSTPTAHEIQTLALSTQVMIDPARRGYDKATRVRLAELFGPPASWTPSTQGLVWARVATVVPAFSRATTFSLEVPCTYDLEVAAAKYFYALADGEVPLSFHFSGTVFYHGPDGRLQVTPVPWTATARFAMPVTAWRAMIADHYPGGGWVRLSETSLAALQERRAGRGLPSFDACIAELLQEGADA
jgi:Family of unknown function (DUF6084)